MSPGQTQRPSGKLTSAPHGVGSAVFGVSYAHACRLAEEGHEQEASRIFEELTHAVLEPELKALLCNDRAVLAARMGAWTAGRQGFQEALAIDGNCTVAAVNLALLDEPLAEAGLNAGGLRTGASAEPNPSQSTAVKIAVVSFLFNWPSSGGGIVHSFELAHFLAWGGYQVQHFYARYDPWEIGRTVQPPPFASEPLVFDEPGWNLRTIQGRFRQAVDRFEPDYVLITDSWNMKPRLAEALRGHRILLRFQAMECLCPLNNVRLLPEPGGCFRQCPLHQLATPAECGRCVKDRGQFSGSLHQAERALSGVGTPEYHECLLRALREAEAVLVVNPLTEAIVSPYARRARVVTAGMDPARFPWPWPEDPAGHGGKGPLQVFFAGLVDEWMKGFRVLHDACARLWRRRQDFELVATGEPPGRVDVFTRFVGWLSQEKLPRHLRAADMLVMPTIAQEALGRSAVEAMAVGRPVIASRIGGLPATVLDGATGLLAEPGDANDLADKIATLLDDPALRERLGLAGRRRFEEHYAWPVIIERHYRPLLQPIEAAKPNQPAPA